MSSVRARRVPTWSALVWSMLTVGALSAATVQAAAFPQLAIDERLQRAVDVFVGEVVRVDAERRGDDPWTLVTFRVERWFLHADALDEAGPAEVTLAFLGGEAPGATPRAVAGFPSFERTERYLVASYGAQSRAASPLVGVTQGLWRERDDVWRDPAGAALALDGAGTLALDDEGVPEERWRPALEAKLRSLRGEP
jgi:hypothetical protein